MLLPALNGLGFVIWNGTLINHEYHVNNDTLWTVVCYSMSIWSRSSVSIKCTNCLVNARISLIFVVKFASHYTRHKTDMPHYSPVYWLVVYCCCWRVFQRGRDEVAGSASPVSWTFSYSRVCCSSFPRSRSLSPGCATASRSSAVQTTPSLPRLSDALLSVCGPFNRVKSYWYWSFLLVQALFLG